VPLESDTTLRGSENGNPEISLHSDKETFTYKGSKVSQFIIVNPTEDPDEQSSQDV
jgi:hypothetical protein